MECPNGWIGTVELQKSSGGTFLQNGWREFVKYHLLVEYDFLVFRYDGDVTFNVQIYDKTACEKDDVCDHESATTTSNQVKEEEDFVQGQFIPSKYHSPVKTKMVDIASDTDSGANEDNFSLQSLPGEGMRTCENVRTFTSELPYFTKKMKRSEVVYNTLRIPNFFWRRHLSRRSSSMLLRGPDGRSWEVTYTCRPSELRAQITGGWPRFLKGYNIVEGDICVFELVGEKEMQVWLVRRRCKFISSVSKDNANVPCYCSDSAQLLDR